MECYQHRYKIEIVDVHYHVFHTEYKRFCSSGDAEVYGYSLCRKLRGCDWYVTLIA